MPTSDIDPGPHERASAAGEPLAIESLLWARREAIVREVVERSGAELDDEARARWHQDVSAQLEHLAIAVGRRAPRLFTDYVCWAKRVRLAREGSFAVLDAQLEHLAIALERALGGRGAAPLALVERARRSLATDEEAPASPLPASEPFATLARRYLASALAKRRHDAVALIRTAAASGMPARELLMHVLAPVQLEVGRLWEQNLITVADEHYCTAATQLAIAQLYDQVFATPRLGRAVMASAATGELHELGVRIVSDLFELDGWDTLYFGASVPREDLLAAAREHRPDLIALSATLPHGIRDLAQLIEALRADPRTRAIPVLVGGHAFALEPRLYVTVGADATASDAIEAVAIGRRLVEAPR